jgi:hypothetical protein
MSNIVTTLGFSTLSRAVQIECADLKLNIPLSVKKEPSMQLNAHRIITLAGEGNSGQLILKSSKTEMMYILDLWHLFSTE